MRILSANVITPTDLYVSSNFSTYFEKVGPEQLAKFYSMNLSATYGLSKNFEFSLNFIPYQDDQKHIIGRMGNSQFAIKYRMPFSGRYFQLGILGFFKFPTAQENNVPYEVFYTKDSAWGGRMLFSFNLSKLISQSLLKLHLNLGYYDHSINDTYFKSEIDQMLMGIGFVIPIRSSQIFMEYSGELFINKQDSVSFNENSNRITAGIKFLGPFNATIDLAADVSLSKRNKLAEISTFHKNYAKWRIWVGVAYRFSFYKYFDKSAKLARQREEQERRKLERIKNRRRKATIEMQKMREILKKKNRDKEKNME
ncbi:hypothetical protein GF337_08155 [candidate division KSB1 bacterium]|nr:hypothetical protein [candidate division KSB1 bacterium]